MSTTAQFVQLGPFFDAGELCGGAYLEHYAAGTTDVKNIYSDAEMLLPLPEQFQSDANGVFNFFADGYYRLLIKRLDGTLLYDLDNWKMADVSQTGLSSGDPVATASTMVIGDSIWAHWTGSTNVATLSGTSLFYWAIADGNFTLVHSANLLLPDNRNRKAFAGDVLFFINEGSGIWRLGGHHQKEGGWTGRQAASIASATTITVPTDGDFFDITGTADIGVISATSAGYRFRARFTGAGLNIIDQGPSLIAPWGVNYRTVPNEVIEFLSLGSGAYIFYSLNGPKERVGTVITSDSPNTPPGFLLRDGQAYSRTTYSGLFEEIGTTHGAGNGTTTFNVADAQGTFDLQIVGASGRVTAASTNGGNANTLGGMGGAQTHTLVLSEVPSKSVNYTAVRNVAGAIVAAGGDKGEQTNSLNVGGSDGAHNNMPPWRAVWKYIRF